MLGIRGLGQPPLLQAGIPDDFPTRLAAQGIADEGPEGRLDAVALGSLPRELGFGRRLAVGEGKVPRLPVGGQRRAVVPVAHDVPLDGRLDLDKDLDLQAEDGPGSGHVEGWYLGVGE